VRSLVTLMRLGTLVAAVATASFFASQAGASGQGPHLALVETTPVVVKGRSFEPGERVRLRMLGTSWSVVVRATPAGRFTLRLTNPLWKLCGTRSLRATGAMGSTALLRGLQLGACGQGSQPGACTSPVVKPIAIDQPCIPPPRD
jgi:hypothetical protein